MKITWITRIIGLLFIVGFVSSAWGRTISLHPEDIDMAATIVEEGPRHGWASYTTESAPGVFRNNPVLISMTHSFLIRYSLDKIPKGQRITNAELSLGVGGFSKSARLFIWRIVADWGVGVNNIYRMQRPKQLLWALPGARGNSIDRATKASSIVEPQDAGEQVINLTEDVELWYSGAAPNYGWQVASEDSVAYFLLSIPVEELPNNWELRVTYEPQ